MNLTKIFLPLVVFSLLSTAVRAQVQRYPADVFPVVSAPHSVYLSDYMAVGSQRLIGNVVFNDFNETSWTFKLKLTIQGTDVSLETRAGFTPSVPITVQPGVPYRFSGSEWTEYFNFNNLNVSGDVSALTSSGRLPEGLYSFCLQVLDYETGDPLSEERCQNVWIQLMDPPLVNSPGCGDILNPDMYAQIPITWQSFNTINPNGSQVNYQQTMWELLEAGANPLNAVANGQALQVFQSDVLSATTYTYGPSDPLLETGKTYIYRVQALDQEGRSYYKNDGYSQYCFFYYGYPTGGKIDLLFPPDGAGFRRGDTPRIVWSSPNNLIPGTGVSYEVVVKEMMQGQDREDAIINNENWHYRKTADIYTTNSKPDNLEPLDIEQQYAWQVKAYAREQEVAGSDIGTFFGPSLVEYFYAGNRRVMVDYLSKKDLNDLKGGGKVILDANPNNSTDVTFEGLKLEEKSGRYYMREGEIVVDVGKKTIVLDPAYDDNGKATFEFSKVKIIPEGLYALGRFKWDLPFAVSSGNKSYLLSEEKWIAYNKLELFGQLALEKTDYELFDPSGFTLQMSSTSTIFINQGKFRFSLNGVLATPESVQSVTRARAGWAFTEAEQLSLIQTKSTDPILVMDKSAMELHPLSSVIDLSDNSSPGKHSTDPYWKGIYIEESEIKIPVGFDHDGQLKVDAALVKPVAHEETELWISTRGLHLKTSLDLGGSAGYFNTFPAEFTSLKLDITNQNVNAASLFRGRMRIPFIDQEQKFNFQSQVCNQGFRAGSIAGLKGTRFTFNPDGGELALNVSVKRAEIVNRESLKMTLDLEWPALDISFTGVPNFRVWGKDHSVGFFKPEGVVALSNQIKTTFRDYPVTIDALSAGRNKDYYGIAVSGKVVMGEDVSGDDGAPAFNLYSLYQNSLLDTDYTPAQVQEAFNLADAQSGLDDLEAELAAMEEDLTQKLEQQKEELKSSTADAIAAAAAGMGGQQYSAEELIEQEEPEQQEENVDVGDVREQLVAYLEILKAVSKNPDDIDLLIEKINNADDEFGETSSLSDLIDQLKNFATDFAASQVASLGDGFLQKVDKVSYDINATISGRINELVEKVHVQVEQAVGQVVDQASSQVIVSFSDDAPEVAAVVAEIAATTKAAIVNEVMVAISMSVNENVVFPVTSFVHTNLSERAHRLVEETARTVVLGALNTDQNPSEVMKEVLSGFEDELKGLGEELAGQVDLNKVLETVKSLGNDAINNIEPKRIVDRIAAGAGEAIAGAVAGKASEAASALANNLLGDEVGISVPVDFGAAGARLLSGGSPKDLLFDPIPVKVRSAALDINGLIHFTKDHPVYGDMWSGDVTALIKVPSPFEVRVAYMNGRKEGVSFWLAEAGGAAASTQEEKTDMSKVGGEMDKKMQEPPKGLKLGPVEVMALRGRVCHHMNADGLGPATPDANTNYAAYLHMIMFGPKNGERMRMEIEAAMNTQANGDFTVAFDGNAQIMNKNPAIGKIDPDAKIKGIVTLKYNSAEKHFFGFVAAEVKTKAVCANGSLLVDVKPGAWRVALGSRESKLRFVLGCAGFGPTGWLDANQNAAQLGLGLEFIFHTDISLDVKVASVGLVIDAGAAAGIMAMIQYNPDFAVMEAGVWLELWAEVLLSYKMGLKKGSVNLADIYMAADATMRFQPTPTILYGKVEGRIKVLFLKFGFNKDFQMNM